MPRPGKKGGGLGASLIADRRKVAKAKQPTLAHVVENTDKVTAKSVLEQTSLDDFLVSAEMANQQFQVERQAHLIDLEADRRVVARRGDEIQEESTRLLLNVPIPRRPQWNPSMTPKELAQAENDAFLEWRRGLAHLEEKENVIVTPYEKNVDFWRQLWRVVERSDVLVEIVDARDPNFFRNLDLENYVTSVHPEKKVVVLFNKADLVPAAYRRAWKEQLKKEGVECIFFSALREKAEQEEGLEKERSGREAEEYAMALAAVQKLEKGASDVIRTDDLLEILRQTRKIATVTEADLEGKGRGKGKKPLTPALTWPTVGFVGFPNVGKSSVINALLGEKKVSVSRTPGKTKHFQTIAMPFTPTSDAFSGDGSIILCDCPGLVFPSVVETKAHLAIRGVVPLDHLGAYYEAPVQLLVAKMGMTFLLKHYRCQVHYEAMRRGIAPAAGAVSTTKSEEVSPFTELQEARFLLQSIALSRGHLLTHARPDAYIAAKRLLRDACGGRLQVVEAPRDVEVEIEEDDAVAEFDMAGVGEDDEDKEVVVELKQDGPEGETEEEKALRLLEEEEAMIDALLDTEQVTAEQKGTAQHAPRQMTKRRARQMQRVAGKQNVMVFSSEC